MEQKWAIEFVGMILKQSAKETTPNQNYKIIAMISLLKNRFLISVDNKTATGSYLIRHGLNGSPILLLPNGEELCIKNKQFAQFCKAELKRLGYNTQLIQLID